MFGTAALTAGVSYRTCMLSDQPVVIMEIRQAALTPRPHSCKDYLAFGLRLSASVRKVLFYDKSTNGKLVT